MEKRWFLPNGNEVMLVAEIPSGYVVRDIYKSDPDGEEEPFLRYSNAYVVNVLYENSAAPVLDPKLAELRRQVSELSDKANALRKELTELQGERKRIEGDVRDIEALRYLEQMVKGLITHYVQDPGVWTMPTVHEIAELAQRKMHEDEKLNSEVPVMTLMRRKDGGFAWRTNQVSATSFIPCLSRDEAVNICQEIILKRWGKDNLGRSVQASKAFEAIGVPVPNEVSEMARQVRVTQAAEKLEKARAALAQVEAEAELWQEGR